MVNLHGRRPIMRLALIAGFATAMFALLTAFEVTINGMAMRNAATLAQIEFLERPLKQAPILVAEAPSVESRIRRLRLSEPEDAETSTVMEELECIARVRTLQLMALNREAVLPRPGGDNTQKLPYTLYRAVFEGGYPKALAALVDLAKAPLVTSVKTVTLERVATDVRMSLELAVYHAEPRNVRTRTS